MTFREAVAMLIGSGVHVRTAGDRAMMEVDGVCFDRVADMLEKDQNAEQDTDRDAIINQTITQQ